MGSGSWKCSNINYRGMQHTADLESKLIECAQSQMISAKYVSNIYSKVFSGVWPYANPNKRLRQKGVDFNPNMSIDRVQYDVAVSVLKEFDIVIILEQFEDTKL